ncbi:MAG TPA: rhomboid family intramembrane serine protease [Terriglobales bacterium]|nr:rhomboid family intramembrane serine protease [Terriglobales bacterium]
MTHFNIATCRRCGAEFSPPIVGAASDLCPQCREMPADAPEPPSAPLRLTTSQLIGLFPATSALIALNLLMFVVMVARGVSPATPTTAQLLRWGADSGPVTLSGQPWRLLVSCFIHAGFLHLLFNMWCLWSLGMFVERYLGRGTYILAYLLAGIGGAVASLWWHPLVVGVGASGAIFGLAGIMVTLLRSGQLALPAEYLRRHSKSIVAFIGYNLFFGFINPHIDNSAHLGGLATGLLLGALLPVAASAEGHNRRVLAFGVCAVLLFGSFTYARSANAGPLALAAGEQALEAKQWDKAAASFEAAIRFDPKQAHAYLGLGYAYLMQEKYAEAVPVLRTGTELAPNLAGGFTNLGYALVKSGRPKEAETPLLRAIQIDPKDADAWENLALAYALEGKVAAARTAAATALRFNPNMKEAREIFEAGQESSKKAGPPSRRK